MSRGGGVAASGGVKQSAAGLIALAIAMIALAITATPAYGASTRAEYVAQVDPICQTVEPPEVKAAIAFFKAFAKFKRETAGHKPSKQQLSRLVRATSKFLGVVSRLETSVTAQIRGVPPAPGDEATVGGWLQKRDEWIALINQANVTLKHHKLKAFLRTFEEAESTRQAAEALVAGFGFRHCVKG